MMLKIGSGIVSVVLLVLVGSLFLPDEFELSVKAPGKVMPVKEWRLIQAEDGALRATLQDHRKGTVDAYAINRFERGDAIQFNLNDDLFDQRFLSVGDTVGTIYSTEIDIRLTELQGELAAQEASLRMYGAGEKPALIEEARQGILRAESRTKEHSSVLSRLRRLHSQSLIAEEELEAAESLQQVYIADVAIAQAQLKARETGARKEQLDLTRTEMEALQGSIAALQKRLQFQTIISPISGYIARSFAPDTLLTVRDTTGFLVLIPVAWKNQPLLNVGNAVEVTIPETNTSVTGILLDIGDAIHRVNGEQVVPAIAFVEGYHPNILPGILVNTIINGNRVPLSTYVKHQLN